MTAHDLDPAHLADLLRRDAEGWLPTMAAVGLLAEHGTWLRRPEFLACVEHFPADDEGPEWARVEWRLVVDDLLIAGVPATGSEVGVLSVAASLAHGHRVDLQDALLSCDERNVALVARAVRVVGGLA